MLILCLTVITIGLLRQSQNIFSGERYNTCIILCTKNYLCEYRYIYICIYYLLELVTKPPNTQEEHSKENATSEIKSHIKKDIPYQSISVNKEIPYPISIPQHIKLIEKIPSQTENKKVIPKNPRNNIENISGL